MSTRDLGNPMHVEAFLRTLRIQRRTRPKYLCALKRFQRLALKGSCGKPPSIRQLCRWAKHQKSDAHDSVCSRARLADRFLDWMTSCGLLERNPFEALREQYRLHSMTVIVEALMSEEPEAVLQRASGPVPFASALGPQMQAHIARMRTLGARYDTAEASFLRFDRYLQGRPDLAGQPLKKLVTAWSATDSNLNHVFEAQRCGRWLSQSLHRLDMSQPVLSIDVDLTRRLRRQQRRAHIYSQEEIHRLLKAASSFPSPLAPLRPLTLYTMVVLAYCTGMRVGELSRITLGDIHLQEGTLDIKDTKFFKSRCVPLTRSVIAVLKRYLVAREAAGGPCTAQSGLFLSRRGSAYSYGMVELSIAHVLRRAGLKPSHGKRGPRVHDLRHTFVVHRMLDWYRRGINPQSRLSHLATYLGHKDIASTLTYMDYTPELLEKASERLRQYGVRALGAVGRAS